MFLISDLMKFGYINETADEHKMMSTSARQRQRNCSTEITDDGSTENKDVVNVKLLEFRGPKIKRKKEGKVYMCTHEGCKSTFSRPWRLNNHLSKHNGEKLFSCEVEGCDKAYTSMSHLKRHNLTSHSRTKVQQTFICPVANCPMILKTKDILLKHMRRIHSERAYDCKVCGISLTTQEKLQSHSKNKHKLHSSHNCDKCNKTFLKIGLYNRHMRRHRIHICHYANCTFATDEFSLMQKHNTSQHPRLLTCEYCDKKIKGKGTLRRHIFVHLVQQGLSEPPPKDPVKRHPCHLCSMRLTTKGSLKRHMNSIHGTTMLAREPRVGQDRAARHDKGLSRGPTRCLASVLTCVPLPQPLNLAILKKNTYSSDDSVSSQVYDLMLKDIQEKIKIPLEEIDKSDVI